MRQLTARRAPLNAQQAGTKHVDRVGKAAASCRARSSTSTAMGYRRQLVTVVIPLGKASDRAAADSGSLPAERLSAMAVDAMRGSSRTWCTRACDVGDRIPARSDLARPCQRARCKERSAHRNEVPLRRPDDADIWTMSFPKAGHIRGLRHAGKGLVSCLRLETTEVLPGAVAVSSDSP